MDTETEIGSISVSSSSHEPTEATRSAVKDTMTNIVERVELGQHDHPKQATDLIEENNTSTISTTEVISKTPRVAKKWSCTSCTFENAMRDRQCWVCGQKNENAPKRVFNRSTGSRVDNTSPTNLEVPVSCEKTEVETKVVVEVKVEVAQVSMPVLPAAEEDSSPSELDVKQEEISTNHVHHTKVSEIPEQPLSEKTTIADAKVISQPAVEVDNSNAVQAEEEMEVVTPPVASAEDVQPQTEVHESQAVEGTVPSFSQNQWSCPACTFFNPIKNRYCSVCHYFNKEVPTRKLKRKSLDTPAENKDEQSVTSKVSDDQEVPPSPKKKAVRHESKVEIVVTNNESLPTASSGLSSLQTPRKVNQSKPVDMQYDFKLTEDTWTCPTCTFENSRLFRKCDICTFQLPWSVKPETPIRKPRLPSTPIQKKQTRPEELSFAEGQTFEHTNGTSTSSSVRKPTQRPAVDANSTTVPTSTQKSSTPKPRNNNKLPKPKPQTPRTIPKTNKEKVVMQSSSSSVANANTVAANDANSKDPVLIELMRAKVRKEIEAKPVKMNPICLEVFTAPPPIRRGMCIIWRCSNCQYDNLLKDSTCNQCQAGKYHEYRYIALCTYHKALEKRKYRRLGLLDEEEIEQAERNNNRRRASKANRKHKDKDSKSDHDKAGDGNGTAGRKKSSAGRKPNNKDATSSGNRRKRINHEDLSYLLPPSAATPSHNRYRNEASDRNTYGSRHTRNNDMSHIFSLDPSIDIDRLLRGRMGRGRAEGSSNAGRRKVEDTINHNPYKAPKIGTKYQVSLNTLPQVSDYHYCNPVVENNQPHDQHNNIYYDILWIPNDECHHDYESWKQEYSIVEPAVKVDHQEAQVKLILDDMVTRVVNNVEQTNTPVKLTTFKDYLLFYKKKSLEVSALKHYYEAGYDIYAAQQALESELATQTGLSNMIPYSPNQISSVVPADMIPKIARSIESEDDYLSTLLRDNHVESNRKIVIESLLNIVDEVDATVSPIIPVLNTKPHYRKTTDLTINVFPESHVADFYDTIVKCGGDNWNAIVGEMGYRYSVAQLQDFYYTIWMYSYKTDYLEAERKHRMNKRVEANRERRAKRKQARKRAREETGDDDEEEGEEEEEEGSKVDAQDDASNSVATGQPQEGKENANMDDNSTIAEANKDDEIEGEGEVENGNAGNEGGSSEDDIDSESDSEEDENSSDIYSEDGLENDGVEDEYGNEVDGRDEYGDENNDEEDEGDNQADNDDGNVEDDEGDKMDIDEDNHNTEEGGTDAHSTSSSKSQYDLMETKEQHDSEEVVDYPVAMAMDEEDTHLQAPEPSISHVQ